MQEITIAVGILIFALLYLGGSISLKVGTLSQPGPGFMPAAVATLLLITALAHTFQCFRDHNKKEEGKNSWFEPSSLVIGAVTIIYPFLLRPLNFLLATFITLFALLRILKYKSTLVSFLIAFFTTIFAFIIFSKFLGVILPAGPLEDLILMRL
ncbi:MAG: tripartite tricarboxylate transporter TctB family protein [Moorella humiferrea]|nr:tripartite tricarboxylate transporter TctB family protein [Moorella humiferrea]